MESLYIYPTDVSFYVYLNDRWRGGDTSTYPICSMVVLCLHIWLWEDDNWWWISSRQRSSLSECSITTHWLSSWYGKSSIKFQIYGYSKQRRTQRHRHLPTSTSTLLFCRKTKWDVHVCVQQTKWLIDRLFLFAIWGPLMHSLWRNELFKKQHTSSSSPPPPPPPPPPGGKMCNVGPFFCQTSATLLAFDVSDRTIRCVEWSTEQ